MDKIRRWEPINKRQEEVLQRSEFELGIGGNRGGGKSEVSIVKLLNEECLNHPQYRFLVLRKNSQDLEDWIFKFKTFTAGHIDIGGKPTTIKLPGGGLGTLGHMANKDSWSHYIGHEYVKILIEELNLWPEEQQYLMLFGSCRTSVPELQKHCQVMSSFNPGNVGHQWIKKRFIDKAFEKPYTDPVSGLTRIFIQLKLQENKMLPKQYEASLRLLPEEVQKAWIDGDWNALAGQFFTRMPELVEPYKFDNNECNFYGSLDFGSSTTGHTSFGFWHIDPDGIPTRIYTWYHRLGETAGTQAMNLVDYIKSFPLTNGKMPLTVFADPAIFAKRKEIGLNENPKSVADFFIEKGLNLVPANNERVNGWNVVRNYFDVDPITKMPRCRVFDKYNKDFWECFEVQVHATNNPDDIAENNYDHIVDETRYFLVSALSLRSKGFKKTIKQEDTEFGTLSLTNYSDSWMSM